MKVEKIEIKKEVLEIPDGQMWVDFAFWKPVDARLVNDGTIPPGTTTGGQTRYEVRKLKRSYEQIPIHYLVSVDDRRIFQDLIQITDDDFARAVKEKTDWWADAMDRELREQKWHIRNLPRWKLLLTRF